MSDPIRGIHLLTLGHVRVRPKNVAGTGTPTLWWTFTSRTWTEPLPVHAVVVEHEAGTLLWDTGQVPASSDRAYFPGGIVGAVYRRQVDSTTAPDETLPAQLAAVGIAPESIALVALSHLHYDHAGNVASLPGIPVLVSEAEHALLREASPEMHGVLVAAARLDTVDWRPVTFEPADDPLLAAFGAAHDIYGDGSLVLLSTPGHSVGSMSLLVRRASGPPLLLVGDVTYDPELLAAGIVPDVGDRAVQVDTARRIAALREALPELGIIAAHDPRAADILAAAGEAAAGA